MKKITIILVSLLYFSVTYVNAQVGVTTKTPTEFLDIEGTSRVRNIPDHNSDYTNGIGDKITYITESPAISSKPYQVIGKSTQSDLVPNNKNTFTNDDNSTAMFVIKRYKIGDWPSDVGNVGKDTDMSSSKWEAIMSNISFSFSKIDAVGNVFNQKHLISWQVSDVNGKWRIWGDINGVQEKSDFVDILFIRKLNVSSEDRTIVLPY